MKWLLSCWPSTKKTTATLETVETSYRKKNEIKFANLITIVLIVIAIGIVKTNNLLVFFLWSSFLLLVLQWSTLSIYDKSAIFICFHKAFHDRLPVTLIDLISKKRATNYSTRTCASFIVPRFNTRYMKDSVAFRGSVLWNAVTNNCSALTQNVPYRDLRLKLKSLVNFNEVSFKITSASTCNFRKDGFVYS